MPLLLALLLLAVAPAQRPSDIVKWSASPIDTQLAAGAVAKITITASIQPGWKLYAIEQPVGGPVPLEFELAEGTPFEIARKQIVAPKAKVQAKDENFGVATRYYERDARFTIPVALRASVAAGPHTIPLEITFQACGAELCLRPFTEKIAVAITVAR